MNSIPLIKGNTPQEINTSIIALKKALSELEAQDRLLQGADKDVQNKIKQINELIEGINELIEGINTHLGTVDTHLTTIDSQITALQPVDTVTSGNMHSVTSNAVANALNIPRVIRVTTTSSDKIIHLGRFTTTNVRQIGAIVEVETNRVDCSSLIIATIGLDKLKLLRMLTTTTNYASEVFLYKTSDYDYDLYVNACTWATTYIKLTATVHLTYDGSEVTSYRGTQVTPISIIE